MLLAISYVNILVVLVLFTVVDLEDEEGCQFAFRLLQIVEEDIFRTYNRQEILLWESINILVAIKPLPLELHVSEYMRKRIFDPCYLMIFRQRLCTILPSVLQEVIKRLDLHQMSPQDVEDRGVNLG